MPFTKPGRNIMLSKASSVADWASIASTAGVELNATRQEFTWNAPSSAIMTMATTSLTFDTSSGADVGQVLIWPTSNETTQFAFAPVTKESFTNAGTYTVTEVTFTLTTAT